MLNNGTFAFLVSRTLSQEDPGDNQVTLEEITQMVRGKKDSQVWQDIIVLTQSVCVCVCIRPWTTVRLNPSRAILPWRSPSSSLSWTTWFLRSSLTSKWKKTHTERGAFFCYYKLCVLLCFYREFFGQGWMKNDKNERTPYIMKTTKHFNDVRDSCHELHRDLVYFQYHINSF